MNNPNYQQLLENRWRRPLTDAENALLQEIFQENPQLKDEWELDVRLRGLIQELPEAPVPSNFTALVLKRVERGADVPVLKPSRLRVGDWFGQLGWIPRLASIGIAVVLIVLISIQFQSIKRDRLASRISALEESQLIPTLEELSHFTDISELDTVPLEMDMDWELALASLE